MARRPSKQVRLGQAELPCATYRVQLSNRFRFAEARGLADYLARLGVSHFYSSPLLRAKRGSLHCYDVVEHDQLNPELGTMKEFMAFARELARNDLRLLLDIVPNHVSASDENSLWMSVLEYGPYSGYAEFFDIRWSQEEKVVLPILADEFDRVLGTDDLEVQYEAETASFLLLVSRGVFVPLTPRSYADILQLAREGEIPLPGKEVRGLDSLVKGFNGMPGPSAAPAVSEDPVAQLEALRRRLRSLCTRYPMLLEAIGAALGKINDKRGGALMSSILASQFFRLTFWRNAPREINYRRFLNLNDYVAIREEDDSVFDESHALIMDLTSRGYIGGLRVDHPDGLSDPRLYFHRLKTAANRSVRSSDAKDAPVYIVAEKILRKGEPLQKDWEVQGTTGYDFLNLLNSLYVLSANERDFDKIHSEFTGRKSTFEEVSRGARRAVIERTMSADLHYLSGLLAAVAREAPRYRALGQEALAEAIAEVASCLPIYRTYLSPQRPSLTEYERRQVTTAISRAKKREKPPDPMALELVGKTFRPSPRLRKQSMRFVMSFQQFTPAVIVKGTEDTALYRFNRLVSLNEVGGEPTEFGTSVGAFHDANLSRRRQWPLSMLATSTHDTKRGEDLRGRINVLSEMPEVWRSALSRWSAMNRDSKSILNGEPVPNTDDEYLLYQTLLGAWPLEGSELSGFVERVVAYMVKASKESNRRTSWVFPSQGYDYALERFVRSLLRDGENPFLSDFLELQARVSRFGILNSLSQLLLKLTSPGVPDVYQGTEVWDFSLVDPDNRRPVDFQRRWIMLDELEREARAAARKATGLLDLASRLVDHPEDGRVKMFVMSKALSHRRAHPGLYTRGDYIPVACEGPRKQHVCAFLRKEKGQSALVIAPRFFAVLGAERWPLTDPRSVWGATKLHIPRGLPTSYTNLLTGERADATGRGENRWLELDRILGRFPIALLEGG